MFMGELGKNKFKVTSQRKKPITQQHPALIHDISFTVSFYF
jgi:hypothetical protein